MKSKVSKKPHPPQPFAPPNRLKPLPNIHSTRKRRMNDLPSVSQEYIKPKVVLFYKNGDRNYRGSHVTVTPRRFRNFDNLLNELTRITNLAQGARYIFTPDTGSRVDSLDQLSDGKSYVCGSYPRLKKINYNHGPDGRSQNKKTVNRNFIPVPPASKLHVESSKPPATVKPKIVNIIRNGVGVNKKTIKILLNKRTAQSYEQVLDDITSTVGVQGGFVKKLYNKSGKVVSSLSEMFGDDDIFIAVGSEKFRTSDIPSIVEESGLSSKGRAETNPAIHTKKEMFPSPPKSSPTKKKKVKERSSPYNSKPATLSNHSKLPSIKKRKEPDGESVKDSPKEESDHVNLSEDDLPDDPPETNKKQHENFNSEKENSEEVLKSFMKRKSPVSSNNSDSDEKKETHTHTNTGTTDNTSSRSSSPEQSKINDKNSQVGSDKPDTISETSKSNLTSPRKSSRESTIEQQKENNSPKNTPRKDSISSDNSDSSDSEQEEEKKEDDTKEINEQEEKPGKENTTDLTLKTDIIGLLGNETPTDNETEELPVYKERLSKVFKDSSEINEFYEIGKKLGDGNFAVVKEVVDKNNDRSFAMKIIDAAKIEGKLAMLNNEIKIQRDCAHPNIVHLYHDMHSPKQIFLIMELISGGDFFDLISTNVSFEEEEASSYMRDLCSGLDYLHQRGIVHRDIKPENLMVSEKNGKITLKIADFGLAMKVTSPIFTICGTPTYVAPEILSEEGYGLHVDVWAAGVILYIMLCGFPPFRSPNRKQTELFDMIEKGEFEYLQPYWDDVSDTAKDLISKILVVDTSERLTSKQVFSHPWLSQFGLDRNNTLVNISPRRTNRFKAVARGIQSIERMKMILRLERDEQPITHVHHDQNKNKTNEELQTNRETLEKKFEKESTKTDSENEDKESENGTITDVNEEHNISRESTQKKEVEEESSKSDLENERKNDTDPHTNEERPTSRESTQEKKDEEGSGKTDSENDEKEAESDTVADANEKRTIGRESTQDKKVEEEFSKTDSENEENKAESDMVADVNEERPKNEENHSKTDSENNEKENSTTTNTN